MKKIIQIVAAIAVVSSITGCATPYMIDRGRDAADILTVVGEQGIGVSAQAGPFLTGLGVFNDSHGLRSGRLGECKASEFELLVLGMKSWHLQGPPPRRKDFGAMQFMGLGIITDHWLVGNKPLAPMTGNFEVAAGVGIGLRLGFNVTELIDFFLGWFGVDVLGDDCETRNTKEKSNQSAKATQKPGAPQ